MAKLAKLLQAAAGAAGGGGGLNVEDVFSTYLWDGAGGTQTIVNGVDLTEGGLVWAKQRNGTIKHVLSDSERGTTKVLSSNLTNAESTETNGFTSFNSNGFTFGSWAGLNNNGDTYASWTFRKAPKFFDVITYSGNGSNQTISHNLGSTPGMIVVKARNNSDDAWYVWHRSLPQFGTQAQYRSVVFLDSTSAYSNYSIQTAQPDNSNIYVGSDWSVSGYDYVMYVFAHNDGDGEFGPDGDADIIKCGSYTGNDGTQDIDLGFEPAWVLVKSSSNTRDWKIIDNMRGFAASPNNKWLTPNSSNSEENINASASTIEPTATGFRLTAGDAETNSLGWSYIYIAICRGPMAVPESATDVFDMSYATDANDASFPVDLMLSKIYGGGNTYARDRLRGGTKYLLTETTNADLTGSDIGFDDMTGTGLAGWGTSFIHYNLRRAPNFFDVVAYTGDGTTSRDIAHNLGVVPELQFIKRRTTSGEWWASATPAGAGKVLYLNRTNAAFSYTAFGTATATTFQTETVANNDTNFSGAGYSWFGFASLDGVSKVGSYTGNGSTQTIDCGFSSGARFVLIKRTDSTGDWYVWDTERGIVAGNDPHFSLNSTAAQVTTDDSIDPVSSGFAVNQVSATNINVSSATYIFYAIA